MKRSSSPLPSTCKTQGDSETLAVCLLIGIVFLCSVLLPGCGRNRNIPREVAYVNAAQANLRDRLAPLYERKGVVRNGERVWVLEKTRRFVRVRSERGEEGWIEERYLTGQDTFDQSQRLAAENIDTPVQSQGLARASLNLHVAPGRDAEHLYQLSEGERLQILKRATTPKKPPQPPAAGGMPVSETKTTSAATPAGDARPEPQPAPDSTGPSPLMMEDWLLVRDSAGYTGWVLGRMLDIDVPLEIAQYAEGQRIVASFVLNQVQDQGKPASQYLLLLTENKDGLPWDYNQIRIFTWNLRRHRYETAYRERKLNGYFPVTVGMQDFGKEGFLPVFTLRERDENGNTVQRKYRLIGPIVRRVLSAEERRDNAKTAVPQRSGRRRGR